MEKISLVTGCAGFLGSHMTDFLLKKKHFVIGIDDLCSGKYINIKHNLKKRFKFHKKNINKINNVLKNKKVDFVFHFAGHGELIPSIEKPLDYFDNNVRNTALLLEILRKYKIKIKKFVYAASASCYGINNKKTNENHPIKIEHPYGFSKYIGEQVCLHWGKTYNIPVISIRIFNAYGPRSRTSNVYGAVIGVFIKQKISGYPLTVIGDGKQKRDFLFVTDLCQAFYKAALSKFDNKVFNLGYGKPQTVKNLADIISKNQIKIPWRPGEPKTTHADISEIKKCLKWKPLINFKEGMKIVLSDTSYWKKAPLWTKKKIKKATANWIKFLR